MCTHWKTRAKERACDVNETRELSIRAFSKNNLQNINIGLKMIC